MNRKIPPNCELHGRGLQQPLNVDSGRLQRKDAVMVHIERNALSGPGQLETRGPTQSALNSVFET